ncbi:hypothetical protein Cylst_3079 [Cylindrospermum stagnale PCC 7417]|uniref:PsbP n=1 Tax=Cylindrospermum stagnale PCC 7417 TaxID=56107 RepID=K9WZK6_9NOST|nr:hypothetical protein [Cylindrospermum stagnale]AFZ25249.1 hypothetical protein Cylst_3079 [Cylindrospermum stagnale PCC 7417]
MMSIAVKTCSLGRIIYTFAFGVGTAIAFWGCSTSNFRDSDLAWKTYSNSRYGFEFPYPSNWTSLATPENNDGIALVSPNNNSVEIRGWAGHQLPGSSTQNREGMKTINENFQTVQGVSGVLVVEVGQKVSLMKLTLTQGEVKYYWQGQSNSQEFQNYYRLFYYIAQQYRIRE